MNTIISMVPHFEVIYYLIGLYKLATCSLGLERISWKLCLKLKEEKFLRGLGRNKKISIGTYFIWASRRTHERGRPGQVSVPLHLMIPPSLQMYETLPGAPGADF